LSDCRIVGCNFAFLPRFQLSNERGQVSQTQKKALGEARSTCVITNVKESKAVDVKGPPAALMAGDDKVERRRYEWVTR